MKPVIWDRKTRWKQFLLLCVAIGFFFTGNTYWWVGKDDEGNDVYTWPTKILGTVLGLIVCIILIYLAYYWLLYWRVGTPNNFFMERRLVL